MPLRLVLPIRPARPATSGCLTRTHALSSTRDRMARPPRKRWGRGGAERRLDFTLIKTYFDPRNVHFSLNPNSSHLC